MSVRRFLAIAVPVAAAAVAVAITLLVTSKSPSSAPAPGPSAKMATLTLGAFNPRVQARVDYTCQTSDGVTVCTDFTDINGDWSKQISVPVGTKVHLQVTPQGVCTIANKDHRLFYAQSETGDCAAVAEAN